MPEVTSNPLTIPTPAVPAGTQAAPVVTTPQRKAVERGMRQEGVINQMREQALERAKVAGRTAQQHVDMINAATLAAVASAVKNPTAPIVDPNAAPSAAPIAANPPAAPAPTPAAATAAPVAAPAAPPTLPVAAQPPAPPVAPSPAVPPAPVEPPKPTFANKAVEVSWNTIRETERQITAQRAQFQQEKAAFEAEKTKLQQPSQELQQLQNGLKTNLAGTLRALGFTAQHAAEAALALNGTPAQAPTPPPAVPPSLPPSAPIPRNAEPPPEVAQMRSQVQQLTDTVLTLQNVIITQQYGTEMSKPEFELLRAMPDALDRAIEAWKSHHAATGKALSVNDACAKAQEELVAAKRAEFERLNSNPAWSKALGSTAQPLAGSAPATTPTPAAPGASTDITSLSSNLAPGGPVPPVTVAPTRQWLPPDEMRRQQAIERARKAGETAGLTR